MSQYKKKAKKKTNLQNNPLYSPANSLLAVLPLILIAAIVPLIVYVKVTKLNAIESHIFGYTSDQTDMFSYYKMVYFLIFSVLSLMPFLFVRETGIFRKERRQYLIPMGVFTLLVLFSSIISEFKSTSFLGFWGRYEGALVITGYIVAMFAAMNLFREEKQVKYLFMGLFGSATIISILGALQLFGIDYFQLDFILNLITPAALKSGGGHMEATFGKGTLFSTLYNPNYVGSYMAMLVPAILVFLIYSKKLSHKLAMTILLVIAGMNWLGCDSRAGLYGGIAAILMLLVLSRKKILQHKVIALILVALFCAGFFTADVVTHGAVSGKLKRFTSFESKENVVSPSETIEKSLQGLTDIQVGPDMASLYTEKGTLRISISGGKLGLNDESNREIPSTVSGNSVSFSDNRFSNIKLNIKPEEGTLEVLYNDFSLISIVLTSDGLRAKSNRWMTERDGKKIETFGFKGSEAFGSNRGYIWSRTIPLLKKAVFLGYGPDTFPIYFPQYDYIGKLVFYGDGGIFVDKAHNMYLQTAMNSGMISLVAMLVLFGVYLFSSIKVYFREKFDSFLAYAGLACFVAFCGYAAAGLFNDSCISVAPVFWVILGLGIGINRMLEKGRAIEWKNGDPKGKQGFEGNKKAT